MKPSRRLHRVVQVTQFQETNAARVLGSLQQQLSEYQQRLRDLFSYRAEYGKRFIDLGKAGLSAVRMRDFQSFMANLDEAIGQQEAAIEQFEVQYDEKKRQWLAARNKTKAVVSITQRYQAQEQQQEEKKFQNEIDDRQKKSEKNYNGIDQ